MKGFIEKLEELLELGGTKRDLKRPVLLFIKFNIWFIFLSFDKGCWVMVLRAIIIIKTYYQKWVMIKAVLRMIMITGENKNYPDKSESVPLGYWEFIPGIV